MEEELNDHELEGRMYAMLHYQDKTQIKEKENNQNALQTFEPTTSSTVRRYWRTSVDCPKTQNPFVINRTSTVAPKPKEEKKMSPIPIPSVDLSLFQTVPQNVKSTIEIIEHENEDRVIIESSDEDEVIEIALPPKPTIMIESSDEGELEVIKENSPTKGQSKPLVADRGVSASPVPSVVSSISDEFIRGDCIALNISSRNLNNQSFDFSLHGPDLLDQSTPAKKKRKKKSKEAVTSTPVTTSLNKSFGEECFATPKSKAKNRKKKSYTITEKAVPNADVYDSDSNQSIIDPNKNQDSFVVSEKSLLSMDGYESDSSHSEKLKEIANAKNNVESSDSSVTLDKKNEETSSTTIKYNIEMTDTAQAASIVDLTTTSDTFTVLDNSSILENIVIGNVTGFTEVEDYGGENLPQNDISQFVSTKIPPILNADLDFNNLNGNKICKRRRRYSLSTLRAEMDKFYNESWGGENFNHREIQKNMSRDKSLWAIDPKDRMPSIVRRKVTCNYCNRTGHRDDTCRLKPPVCYMCGLAGHFEPRCPRKICVNCGEPNYVYSTMCRKCCAWGSMRCSECGQNGHPTAHCPDLWRRYHNTTDENMPMAKNIQTKKHYQMFCSGCTRRGHLIHTCKITIPFSGLPINSPYVYLYRPIHAPSKQDSLSKLNTSTNHCSSTQLINKNNSQDTNSVKTPQRVERNNKRQSKSPSAHESHVNKKRNMSNTEDNDTLSNNKPTAHVTPQRKTPLIADDNNKSKKETNKNALAAPASSKIQPLSSDKMPDFIPITSTNYDKQGQIIQDNEVSDTSDVVISARIYVTNDIIHMLKTEVGAEWLQEMMTKLNIVVQCTDINSFLSIQGKVADQEAFQAELRDWTKGKHSEEASNANDNMNPLRENNDGSDLSLIPKNRNNLLRQLSKALSSLNQEIGDPKAMYKELTFFQNRHKQLLNEKAISPKRVSNNKKTINEMFKKLNMVLLGQAGLADGSDHLSELYSYREKLMNSRQKNIPPEQRKEIGHHYYSIFASIPRDDYLELLKEFYHTTASFKKKNKNKPLPLMSIMTEANKANIIPSHQTFSNTQSNATNTGNASKNNCLLLRQKLVFFHQRLLRSRPNEPNLKKTRIELVRRLHSLIGSIVKKAKLSSKTVKKMKKAQEQAQLFLANL